MSDVQQTTPIDISPEAVDMLAEWCESGGRQCPTVLRPSAMLRELRTALTAEASRLDFLSKYWRRGKSTLSHALMMNGCPYASLDAIRALGPEATMRQAIDAAMENDNG